MADEFKLEKLKRLRALGIDPYPYSFRRTIDNAEIRNSFESLNGKNATIAGRVVGLRHMGKLYFLDMLDQSGKLQVIASADSTEKASMELLELIDTGDIIGVEGIIGKSKRGEISLEAKHITMLGKSLRQMPEKFHGLNDTEMRYRKRYLDLIANPEVRGFFMTRARILKYMRDFLDRRGYIEFETPVLQPIYGGGQAKPFKTRYEALNTDVYLRVADELYLKRLVIGGFEKVYEVSKDFRNEDIDSTHNPEFTQIELYEAYKDYNDFMAMTEELMSGLVKALFGTHQITYQGKKLDFTPPFKRIYWVDEIKKKAGIDVSTLTDEEAPAVAKKEGLKTAVKNAYHVADALFDKYVKSDIFDPAFVVDFPSYMCPLTKDKRGNRRLSERFELFIAGTEVANCYSELTDPVEQRRKFEEQEAERRSGDVEAPPSDDDFIEAVEYGMPPMAGIGISIDRPAMILTGNTSIKEIIAFPAMKPKGNAGGRKKHAEK